MFKPHLLSSLIAVNPPDFNLKRLNSNKNPTRLMLPQVYCKFPWVVKAHEFYRVIV